MAKIECNLVLGGEEGEYDRTDEATNYASDEDLGGGHESGDTDPTGPPIHKGSKIKTIKNVCFTRRHLQRPT